MMGRLKSSFLMALQTLKASLVNRQERWKSFRAHITSRAKLQFGYLLSERSYRGRLLADHSNKLLDIQVAADAFGFGEFLMYSY